MTRQLSGSGIQLLRVGYRRRVRFVQLIARTKQREIESQQAMEALVRQAQELGLGYGRDEECGFVDGYLLASGSACEHQWFN